MPTIIQTQQQSIFALVLTDLIKQFNGAHFVTPVQAGSVLGYKANTCYCLIAKNEFPLPLVKIGKSNKKMVRLIDLARLIIQMGDDDMPPSLPTPITKRGRGRPPKGTGPKELVHAVAVAVAAATTVTTAADADADADADAIV